MKPKTTHGDLKELWREALKLYPTVEEARAMGYVTAQEIMRNLEITGTLSDNAFRNRVKEAIKKGLVEEILARRIGGSGGPTHMYKLRRSVQ